jgi:SAM-dependent methyltransferase
VAKRTGKTHENLENQITPPPVPHTTTGSGRHPRRENSGPIGISGGDFATPSARKRTTTQPRGLPVIRPPANVPTPALEVATTPPTVAALATLARNEGAVPESPFGAPPTGELGDAASRLAAEAAAVRALDSGPLTPPPTVDDPGPTPPPLVPKPAEPRTTPPPLAPVIAPSVAEWTPPAVETTPPPVIDAPPLVIPAPSASFRPPSSDPATASSDVGDLDAGDSPADGFAARPTPRSDFAAPITPLRVPTPRPGAIPTDAMSSDGALGIDELPPPHEPAAADVSPIRAPADGDGAVAVADELEVEEAAETFDALPAEALADASPPTPPPAPRTPAAPPPIPIGTPRRKTGEVRAPEVPAAQVVASIVSPVSMDAPTLPEALAQRPRRPKRSKPWFEEVFDEDYLRTLPFMSADQTLREVEFIESSLGLPAGARVLDIGCGYGRHAIELVQRGLDVTGLDLSLPLLIRAADEAQRRAMSVNFVHADMREMAFEQQFDGAYCMLTSFGYFDEDTNLKVAEGIGRALKPGARFLVDLVNRDYVVGDLPSRVWWEGNGCVVLEEVDFNFHTSRILTHRSIVFEDGRQVEQEISVRAYSLHEVGRLLRQAGFRVLDISGSLATRGHFFGQTSRNLLLLAEKRTDET